MEDGEDSSASEGGSEDETKADTALAVAPDAGSPHGDEEEQARSCGPDPPAVAEAASTSAAEAEDIAQSLNRARCSSRDSQIHLEEVG